MEDLSANYIFPKIWDADDDFYCLQISCKSLGGTLIDFRNKTKLEEIKDPTKKLSDPKYPDIFIF
jgi:hypothetical protein